MKSNETQMVDLTEAKNLLDMVDGGTSRDSKRDDSIINPPCDLWNCMVPLYGAITNPRSEEF